MILFGASYLLLFLTLLTFKAFIFAAECTVGNCSSKTYPSSLCSEGDICISNSIATISESAFVSASNITSASLNGTTRLKSIQKFAFNSCSKLTTIDFSGVVSLETLGYAFMAFTSSFMTLDLTPCKSLVYIDSFIAYGSSLTMADLSGLSSLTTLNTAPFAYAKKLTTVSLRGCSSLKSIPDYAFNEANALTSVDLTGCSSISSIGYGSFYNTLVYDIVFSDLPSLKTIGDFAFVYSSFKTIDFTGTVLETVGTSSFKYCLSLVSISFGRLQTLTAISTSMLAYNPKLTTIMMDGLTSLKTIGNGFCYQCYSLSSVDLSGLISLISIGSYAFFSTTSLYEIDLSDLTSLTTLSSYSFAYSAITEANFYGLVSLTSIATYAFSFTPNLVRVDFTGCSLNSIEESAFACGTSTSLRTVVFSGATKLTTIGDNAFLSCYRIEEVDLSGMNSLFSIGSNAFSSGNENVISRIKSISFNGCSSLQIIGQAAFGGCHSVLTIDFTGATSLSAIGSSAFVNTRNLTTLDLSPLSSLTTISSLAFGSALSLTSVNMNGLSKLMSIGSQVFRNCRELKTVYTTGLSSVTNIYSDAFMYDAKLSEIDFTGFTNLISIGENAFMYTSLESLDLSSCRPLINIDQYAFACIPSLRSVDLSTLKSFKQIGAYSFYNDSSLSFINFDGCSALVSIGDSAFEFTGLEQITLRHLISLESIGYAAFRHNPSLVSVDMSGMLKLTAIGSYAFYNTSLESIRFPASITTIGDYAFAYITSITYACWEGAIPSNIASNAFQGSNIGLSTISFCTVPTSHPTSQPTSQPSCSLGSIISGKGCSECPPGQYSSETNSRVCINCAIGKFSDKYDSSSCTFCYGNTYSLREGSTSCDAYYVNADAALSASYMSILAVLYCGIIYFSGESVLVLASFTLLPSFDAYSDLYYITNSKFMNATMFGFVVAFYILPNLLFLRTLNTLKAAPRIPVFPGHYYFDNKFIWLHHRDGMPTINGEPCKYSYTSHETVFKVVQYITLWITLALAQALYFLSYPLYFVLYFLFLCMWLLIGFFLYQTKLISVGVCWNYWFTIWSQSGLFNKDVNVDLPLINETLFIEFALETLPQLLLQLVNGAHTGFFDTPGTFVSVLFSLFMSLNQLWSYLYFLFWKRLSFQDIPLPAALRIVTISRKEDEFMARNILYSLRDRVLKLLKRKTLVCSVVELQESLREISTRSEELYLILIALGADQVNTVLIESKIDSHDKLLRNPAALKTIKRILHESSLQSNNEMFYRELNDIVTSFIGDVDFTESGGHVQWVSNPIGRVSAVSLRMSSTTEFGDLEMSDKSSKSITL